jgi:hypothetical protein
MLTFAAPLLFAVLAASAEPRGALREAARETAAVAALARGGPETAWPGFDIFEQPVLLLGEEGSALFSLDPPKAKGFRPAGLGIANLYYRPGKLPGAESGFDPTYRLDGMEVFSARVTGSDSPTGVAALVLHERFHIFQGAIASREYPGRFVRALDGVPQPRISDYLPEDVAMMLIEDRLLAEAMLDLEAGRPVWRERMRDFVAVRSRRRKPPEASEELDEGLAHYVELETLRRRGGTDSMTLLPWLTCASRLLERGPLSAWEFWLAKDRYYHTGGAQARALEADGADWRPRVAAGAGLFDLVSGRFPVDSRDAAVRLIRIRRSYSFDRLFAAWKAVVREGSVKTKDARRDFDNFQGARLVLETPFDPERTKIGMMMNRAHELSDSTTLFPSVEGFTLEEEGLKLVVRGASLLLEQTESMRLEILVPGGFADATRPPLDKWTAAPRRVENLSLSSRLGEVELTAKKARISRDGSVWRISIVAR